MGRESLTVFFQCFKGVFTVIEQEFAVAGFGDLNRFAGRQRVVIGDDRERVVGRGLTCGLDFGANKVDFPEE